jgi:hypothetical protein
MKMLQVLSRARAHNYFKARSTARDSDTDYARAASILRSIEHELEEANAEHAGLTSRIDDVLGRAAATLGDDSDEYLTRDPKDGHHQNLFGTEIAKGQRRLSELGPTIEHFQFLKTALITRFPDLNLRMKR